MKLKNLSILLFLTAIFVFLGCKFDSIDQPEIVASGETFTISVVITDAIDETTNAHKGVLCILIPADWSLNSAGYSGDIGSGLMSVSPDWGDSAEYYYPSTSLAEGMKWVGLISDTGYTYTGGPTVTVEINLTSGDSSGCFELAYIATKASPNLIGNSGWSPFSYPHTIGVGDTCASPETYYVEPATDWSDLFDCTSGWTGSDASYSIPLSGYERPNDPYYEGTLFVYGDTFIGEVDGNDRRQNFSMIRNTAGFLASRLPQPDSINFIWRDSTSGDPRPVFMATTPLAGPADWIWPMDGIALNDSVYVYGLRLEPDDGVWGFAVAGVTLISFPLDSLPRIVAIHQIDMPGLFCDDTTTGNNIVMGQALLPLTAESGNSEPDGYIYIYGPRSTSYGKKLLAGRFLPENIRNDTAYEFWNGTAWVSEVSEAVELADGLSQEFSVTQTDDGQYLAVFINKSSVGINFGDSPVGPFKVLFQTIYVCPEPFTNSNIFVYNAKAHPHLSQPNQLLISYNVNSMSLNDLVNQADIYRPRFITLYLDSTVVSLDNSTIIQPQHVSLEPNYPNPFNASTNLRFSTGSTGKVQITIFDLLGRQVREISFDQLNAGSHQVLWKGRNDAGCGVGSGVYIYRISLLTGDYSQAISRASGKMILLK